MKHPGAGGPLYNHRAFHQGSTGGRVFPELRRPRALRRWLREWQCGLLWGHCHHRREGLFRMLAWWECCLCAHVATRWPADQCAFCDLDEKIGTMR